MNAIWVKIILTVALLFLGGVAILMVNRHFRLKEEKADQEQKDWMKDKNFKLIFEDFFYTSVYKKVTKIVEKIFETLVQAAEQELKKEDAIEFVAFLIGRKTTEPPNRKDFFALSISPQIKYKMGHGKGEEIRIAFINLLVSDSMSVKTFDKIESELVKKLEQKRYECSRPPSR